MNDDIKDKLEGVELAIQVEIDAMLDVLYTRGIEVKGITVSLEKTRIGGITEIFESTVKLRV